MTNKLLPDILIFPIEYSILILASINALYCLMSYLHSIYKSFIQQLYSKRKIFTLLIYLNYVF